MPTPPPRFLFLSINEICNLRCQHCEYWRTKQPSLDVLSITRQAELLAEFAELSPKGTVVICGGEPMLDVPSYFHVCETSRALGLRTLSVVNGTMIATPSHAERVIRFGPDEISISLDGPTAQLHDRMRGQRGAFTQATSALRLLLNARTVARRNAVGGHLPRIYAIGLLATSTYQHLDAFYDLVLNQIRADKLKLNALQPSFLHTRLEQERACDDFFASESQVDPDLLAAELSKCNAKYHLHYNPEWLRQVVDYFRVLNGRSDLDRGWTGPFVTGEHICNSPERNIMIDPVGRASLCFSNAFPRLQTALPGDLRRFWEGSTALRSQMAECNSLCGISHSVRREPATLKSDN